MAIDQDSALIPVDEKSGRTVAGDFIRNLDH
jgi:hypothetical protein